MVNPMDWSKAKNILIVGFIVTNIFLIFNIQKQLGVGNEIQYVNREYLLNVEEHLRDNGIYLHTDISDEVVSLPVLVVRYKNFDSDKIAREFLARGYTKEVETTDRGKLKRETFTKGSESISIEGNKRLVYRKASNEENYSLGEDIVTKISNDFLKEHKLLKDDIILDQIYYGIEQEIHDRPVYKLIYNQTYKDKFLGESYIHVYVNKSGVIALEAMLLEYEKTAQHRKKKIISAAEALMRGMNTILQENQGPIYVKELEVGYYFSPANYTESDWKDVDSGTAFPSWKITLQNGKTYFVEAYKN